MSFVCYKTFFLLLCLCIRTVRPGLITSCGHAAHCMCVDNEDCVISFGGIKDFEKSNLYCPQTSGNCRIECTEREDCKEAAVEFSLFLCKWILNMYLMPCESCLFYEPGPFDSVMNQKFVRCCFYIDRSGVTRVNAILLAVSKTSNTSNACIAPWEF